MIRYKLENETENLFEYSYTFDAEETAPGLASINKNSGEIIINKRAGNDEFGWGVSHLVSTLRVMFAQKTFDTSGIVAWY